jgi:hypothetical protein
MRRDTGSGTFSHISQVPAIEQANCALTVQVFRLDLDQTALFDDVSGDLCPQLADISPAPAEPVSVLDAT